MSISPIDYANLALSRIAQQHKNKPNFVQLVQDLAQIVQDDIETPINNFFTIYDIDKAEGHNLDVIGDIVGQPRVLIDYTGLEFFGYDGASNSGTYGDLNDVNIGARYISDTESIGSEVTLSDPEYLIFIKARILKNYSASTPEDIIESSKLIFSSNLVRYSEGVMSFDLSILSPVDENTLNIVSTNDILPRPTGVGLNSITSMPSLISIDGTGRQFVDENDLTFSDVYNNKSRFSYVDNPLSIGSDFTSLRFDGTEWELIHYFGVTETWTNSSTANDPPKTGWSASNLGSTAPTLIY